MQILAGQVPASTERSNPNVSFQPGHGAGAGADEVSRRGWARFGESSAGDRLPWDGSSPAKPRAQEQGQDSGRDVQEGSLPSWQRSPRSGVTPEPPLCPQGPAPAPTCFNFCTEESQKQSPGSGKAPEWPFQPSRKNLHGLGWLGCRRDISPPHAGKGLRELMASSGLIPAAFQARFSTDFLCWIPHPPFCLALIFHKKRLESVS